MTKTFPNMMKIIKSLIQKAERTPSKRNNKKSTQWYIIFKFLKTTIKRKY